MKYFNSKLGAHWISILLFASLLITSAACGVSLAKYADDKTVDNISLTVVANYILQKGTDFNAKLQNNTKNVERIIFDFAFNYPGVVNSNAYNKLPVAINNSNRVTYDITMYYNSSDTTVYVLSEGNIYANPDSARLLQSSSFDRVLTSVEFNNFNTSKVSDMSYLFNNRLALTDINVGNWDVSNVTNMAGVFDNCRALSILDLSKWDVSKVTTMAHLFDYCFDLKSIGISDWNVSNVTDMSSMFVFVGVKEIDLSKWNTSNVTKMNYMFSNCNAELNLRGSFSTANVTSMTGMFLTRSCESLDLSNFDTANVTNMADMFYYVYSSGGGLKYIYVSDKFVTTNVKNGTNMFTGRKLLVGGSGTKYNNNYVDETYARIDGGTSAPGYFTAAPGTATNSIYSATGTDEAANGFSLALDLAS